MTTRVQDFNVFVGDILGQPGSYRDLRVSGSLPELGTALARLESRPVSARLRAESVVEGILVSGHVAATAVLQCARCLEEISSDIDAEVCELFVAPGHEAPEEEAYRVEGTDVDLEPMLRDALALDLPLNPLCREECKGLCAQCGQDLNHGTCGCSAEEIDPRWAPLAALRHQLEV